MVAPKLKECYRRGLEVFLFFGELNAGRDDGKPLTEDDRVFLKKNKPEIVLELGSLLDGVKVSYDSFLEDRRQLPAVKIK